MDASKSSVTLQ